jgi:type VI secretion system secreted protein Hcp
MERAMKRIIYVLFVLAAISGLNFMTASNVAAIEVFVKIAGIKGESIDRAHFEWIDATSINHTLSNTGGEYRLGGGTGVTRAEFDDFLITKKLDSSSPILMKLCASGQHISEVIIELVRSTSVGKVIFARYVLNDVIVSSVNVNFGQPAGEVAEQIQFNYGIIKQEYLLTGRDGRPAGTVRQGWDLMQNKSL